jgi:integrase
MLLVKQLRQRIKMNTLTAQIYPSDLSATPEQLAFNKEALYYLGASLSDNTRINYASGLKHFIDWGGTLPCDTMTLINYVTDCAEFYNPVTITYRVYAIAYWHKLNKKINPTDDVYFAQIMKGIKNTKGKIAKRATSLTKADIDLIHDNLIARGRLIDLRDNALIQIGFYGAFRRAELTAILIENIAFEDEGIKITIPRSKTDQEGKGAICAIPYSNNEICAINCLKKWLDFLKSHGIESGPLFRSFMRDLKTPSDNALSANIVTLIVKNVVKDYGIGDPKLYSGHSLRRGFATAATRAGAKLHEIMKQGRWENVKTVMKYIEEADPFMSNAVDSINAVQ